MVRCTTETTAIHNSDSDVWQSAAMGMDQNDLAAAWRTPLVVQAGARLVSQPPTPAAQALVGDDLPWSYLKKASVRYPTLSAMLHRISLIFVIVYVF